MCNLTVAGLDGLAALEKLNVSEPQEHGAAGSPLLVRRCSETALRNAAASSTQLPSLQLPGQWVEAAVRPHSPLLSSNCFVCAPASSPAGSWASGGSPPLGSTRGWPTPAPRRCGAWWATLWAWATGMERTSWCVGARVKCSAGCWWVAAMLIGCEWRGRQRVSSSRTARC